MKPKAVNGYWISTDKIINRSLPCQSTKKKVFFSLITTYSGKKIHIAGLQENTCSDKTETITLLRIGVFAVSLKYQQEDLLWAYEKMQ